MLFALERYERHDRSAGVAAPEPVPVMPAGAPARLMGAVHLVADDVVLALVEGPDAETVSAAATAAGWRVDRITPAAWMGEPITGGER
ncbi:MAG TPA: hypothetical protein VGD67_01130 [Pseudonocardiaceae bacterium]